MNLNRRRFLSLFGAAICMGVLTAPNRRAFDHIGNFNVKADTPPAGMQSERNADAGKPESPPPMPGRAGPATATPVPAQPSGALIEFQIPEK